MTCPGFSAPSPCSRCFSSRAASLPPRSGGRRCPSRRRCRRPTESGYAPVNGIEMYYAVYGAGDPVLLIHGGLGHADIWASQVATMSKTHKVIVADSRGHGRSTRNADPYGYDLMASDYLALLDYLKIDKTALVGWSDGGIIGIDIAHQPSRAADQALRAGRQRHRRRPRSRRHDQQDLRRLHRALGPRLQEAVEDARRIRRLRRPDQPYVGKPAELDQGTARQDHHADGDRRAATTTRRSSASTPNTWPPSFRAPS